MALGAVKDLDELRQIVRNSENVDTYEPHHNAQWQAAYERLLANMKK